MPAYPVGGYSPSAWTFTATPPTAYPATIAESASYDSGVIAITGYNSISVSAELTQAGQLSIQRYLDAAGNIPIGAAITQALSANTLGTVAVNYGLAFSAFQVAISNSSGSNAATLSQVAIVCSQSG